MDAILASLAVGHHVLDVLLDATGASRNKRLFIGGIGIGWSAFWLIKQFTEPPIMVISNPDLEKDYAIIEI